MRGLPLLARLDGRAFHTFTRDLRRPYEPGMSTAMIETTRYLVHEMTALIGYTQSDEITLAWYEPSQSLSDYAFDGRFQRFASVLAGMASARFCQLVVEHLPAKVRETPHFDCRVWQVPALQDAADVFVWREDDATKNSITMAAGALLGPRARRQALGHKQDMLWQKGVNWNDFPSFFKRGTYLQRRTFDRGLTDEERARIPEAHRPPPGTTSSAPRSSSSSCRRCARSRTSRRCCSRAPIRDRAVTVDLVVFCGLQASARPRSTASASPRCTRRAARTRGRTRATRSAASAAWSTGACAPAGRSWSTTHPTPLEREALIAIARAAGARAVSYAFVTSVEDALCRNAGRDGRARIEDIGIFSVASKLVAPSATEGFDARFEVRLTAGGLVVLTLSRDAPRS